MSNLALSVRSPELALDPTPPETEIKVDNTDNSASGEADHRHITAGTVVAVIVFVGLILLAVFISVLRFLRRERSTDEEQQANVDLQMPDYPSINNTAMPLPPQPARTERRRFPVVQEPAMPIDMPTPTRRGPAAPSSRRLTVSFLTCNPSRGNSVDIGDANVTRASRLASSSTISRTPYPARRQGRRKAEWPLRVSTERALASDGASLEAAAQVPLPRSYNSEREGRDSFEEVSLQTPIITTPRARAEDDVFGPDVQTRRT